MIRDIYTNKLVKKVALTLELDALLWDHTYLQEKIRRATDESESWDLWRESGALWNGRIRRVREKLEKLAVKGTSRAANERVYTPTEKGKLAVELDRAERYLQAVVALNGTWRNGTVITAENEVNRIKAQLEALGSK